MRRAIGAAALLLLLPPTLSGLSACGSDAGGATDSSGRLRVLAAASLTEAFATLADRYEQEHPGVKVSLVTESSATLAQQVQEGAPADVLATADATTMQRVVDSGDVSAPQVFASNRMVLVVPADNPARVTGFSDLDRPGVSYIACVETAPCGAVARTLLAADDIDRQPVSLEVDVKATLAKVVAGEVDAGLVYATDARAAGAAVLTLPVPGAGKVLNRYPIAVTAQSTETDLARAWVALVLSGRGQQILADAGFGPPER